MLLCQKTTAVIAAPSPLAGEGNSTVQRNGLGEG
jgi:hypothetical protein